MADVDTIEAAIAAEAAGADLIATTLYGYTAPTQHLSLPGFDLLTQLVRLNSPAICEGISSPTGSSRFRTYAVVVGTAITGIDHQVKRFAQGVGSGVGTTPSSWLKLINKL